MMIPLKEFAIRNGKNPDNMRQKANRGTFKTAKKIGRDWFIDEDEAIVDRRIRSGAYIGWRKSTGEKRTMEETKRE